MSETRLPNIKERVAIVGRTGSGKSQLAAWLLSHAPFDKIPYVIIDHKHDDDAIFNKTARIKEISLKTIPKIPGLYVIRPDIRWQNHDEILDGYFRNVLDRQDCGLYIDEGTNINRYSKAFRSLLVQGRSKHCPVITLSQRPVDVTSYIFSEADFLSVFHLSMEKDKETVQRYLPKKRIDLDKPLPQFYSHWYDVKQDKADIFAPVPDENEILDRIEKRLEPKKRNI